MQRLLNKIAGDRNEKQLTKYRPLVEQINRLDEERDSLDDLAIKERTFLFKERLAQGASLDDLLVEAFATVKQACKRMCGSTVTVKGNEMTRTMIPYDVQLLGGIILHKGNIAEMRTGEGKTLVATLPAYLNALTGKGVHVVTVNDYLASRDAEWMGHLYTRLGLTVGVVTKQSRQGVARREAYRCDITYVENSELGFDYLRDNLLTSQEERTVTNRPLHFAIVDEVDSILIDEARTPMIISQASGEPTEKYDYYAKLVQLLTPAKGKKKVPKGFLQELLQDAKKTDDTEDATGDYRIDEKTKSVTLSTEGIKKLEGLLKVENLYRDLGYQEIHHIENALKAQAVYNKDKEYIIRDGEILLVDDHTGRVMPGRRYSEGLHQAIEAKEQVTIQRESKTLATITYQHFFKLYGKLCGMTGTAMTEAEEFEKIYSLSVIQVPTHRSIIRVDKNDMVYFNQNAKRKAVVDYIKFYHDIGLPLLIGTSSIETSELVSSILRKIALPHTVLNAKYHEQEANIIMNAGKTGSVVVATNMAGRGTDIKLDEHLIPTLARSYAHWVQRELQQKKNLSLVVYSQKEFDVTISSLQEVCGLTDEQVRSAEKDKTAFGNDGYVLRLVFNTKKKKKEDAYAEILFESNGDGELIEKDLHYGLFILGTEKHDSRRIDNQLRGRAGRQGDPGISQFFVALDDEIMRKMGGDKIQSIARMMLSQEELENIAFTQSQFTNSIQRAQKQMEAWHFGIRKHLFEYDSVIDKQRTRIYAKRDSILKKGENEEVRKGDIEKINGELTIDNGVVTVENTQGDKEKNVIVELDVVDEITSFIHEIVHSLVSSFTATHPRQTAELTEELQQILGGSFAEDELTAFHRSDALEEFLQKQVVQAFDQKIGGVDEVLVTDICRRVYLSVMDKHRVEHIDEMHYLREKVGLYGYAQIDPLVIYKKEAFEKFQRLLFTIKKETLAGVMRVDFAAHADAQHLAQQISTETKGEVDMMAMLKAVTKGLTVSAKPSQTTSALGKKTVVEGQQATVLEEHGDVEVIELEDTTSSSPSADLSGLKTKLRPNDKVNVQHPDGKIEYGVKRKKVKEEVEAGSLKIL